MSTIDRARRVVQSIIEDHGFVREESLQAMQPEIRREVEEALLAKDRKIGSSVLTLAKNLYNSDARLIFELLQNADDNQYENATSTGDTPYLSFKVYSDQIVVECNEDGFNERNIDAICDVGKSSKSGSHGYIGAKGIGFKSVFMAAWKVHIQSGNYSFRFVHRKGDSGMGMITPIWEEPKEILPGHLTRITLFLDQDNKQRESVRKQLHELQDSLLLFLRKIRQINVMFYDDDGRQTSSNSLSIHKTAVANRMMLKRTSIEGSAKADIKESFYHVTKHTERVSRSQNREYSEDNTSSAENSIIVLAFPLKPENSEPIIAPQEMFAFLPMRQMGFNFIIQADWDTDASRQDVVKTSQRNKDLGKGIAGAFVKAVLQFCEHDTLQYQWMRYLPQKDSFPDENSFWTETVSSIKKQIESTPVVRSRGRGDLRLIEELRYRSSICDDESGQPLFADLPKELYLSDRYLSKDRGLLDNFGMKRLLVRDIICLVEQDLGNANKGKSKIKGKDTEEDWHSRAAVALQLPIQQGLTRYVSDLKRLDLVPLQDGGWVAAITGPIYFPKVNGILIPCDLDLQLVEQSAAENKERARLFEFLGVNWAEVGEIRKKIFEIYKSSGHSEQVTLDMSRGHLHFLYLTHDGAEDRNYRDRIQIHDENGEMRNPDEFDLHIPDDHPYGPRVLFGDNGKVEDTEVYFIDNSYLTKAPDTPPGTDLTWTEWLQDCIGVRRELRLVSRDESELSPSCKWISENRCESFLGFLKHLWPIEGDIVQGSQEIQAKLKEIFIPCVDGETHELQETHLPLPSLQDYCRKFMDSDECFPFIQLPEDGGNEGILAQWSFLAEFGVSINNDLRFRRHVLCLKTLICADSIQNISQLASLYLSIDASQQDSGDPAKDRSDLEDEFKWVEWIFVPAGDETDARWTKSSLCRWDAPEYVTEKYPLRARYSAVLAGSDISIERLGFFFQKTLGIPDMSLDDIICEIRAIKESSLVKADISRRLYRLLYEKHSCSPVDVEKIRDAFEEYSLVYVEQGGQSTWHKPSECLWSTTTRIEGRIAINSYYEDLKNFFVGNLLVKSADLKMVYDELLGLADRKHVSVDDAKDLLRVFNSHLCSERTDLSSKKLLYRKVFPVRGLDGKSSLQTAREEFVIIDREGDCSEFRELLETLDFSLSEICRLRPFIIWAGLENRYLSKLVKEISRLEGGVAQSIARPRRDLRTKAYGLLRVAASFNSPRYDTDPAGLYDILHGAITLETEGISSRLVVEQDGQSHEIEVSKSQLHIALEDNSLIVYVPKDVNAQDVCFKSKLPRSLAGWLMTDPSTGVASEINDSLLNIINAVLDCRISAVASILKEEGIPEIGIADRSEVDAIVEISCPPTSLPAPSTPVSYDSSTDEASNYGTPFTDVDDDRVVPTSRGSRSPRAHGSPRHSSVVPPDDLSYARLLNKVVLIARSASFPEFGSSDMNIRIDGWSEGGDEFDCGKTTYGLNSWAHRKMIGAAGELLVYELLSSLNSSLDDFDFNIGNWQSKIRGNASRHADYMDLRNWEEPETSDIVYEDTKGIFTTFLIEKGYLNKAVYEGRTPLYYIEVKTTADECKNPFFVSKGQFKRMRESTNGPLGDQNPNVIYTVFRVFNLGKNTTALKIYIDPEEQRRINALRFSEEGWTVVPSVDS